jgi:hypothetical protein
MHMFEVLRVEENPDRAVNVDFRATLTDTFRSIWDWYPSYMLDLRIEHCRSVGEDLSRAGVDGNLKLAGKICGRPVAELAECKPLGLFTATPCSEAPAFKKRRCCKHDTTNPPEDPHGDQIEVITKHRRHRILRTQPSSHPYEVFLKVKHNGTEIDDTIPGRWTEACFVTPTQLQEYWQKQEATGFVAAKSAPGDLASSKCATHKESTQAYKKLVRAGRLGGWLLAVTSSGKIIHAKEFTGAESVSLRYFFVAEMAEKIEELSVIVHDDSCHLRKFAGKHARSSTLAQRLAFPHMNYITDELHSKGHVDPWCLQNCSPKLPANQELLNGFKTSASETVNSVLGRHKFTIRNMKPLTRSFFMHEVVDSRNKLGATGRN